MLVIELKLTTINLHGHMNHMNAIVCGPTPKKEKIKKREKQNIRHSNRQCRLIQVLTRIQNVWSSCTNNSLHHQEFQPGSGILTMQ